MTRQATEEEERTRETTPCEKSTQAASHIVRHVDIRRHPPVRRVQLQSSIYPDGQKSPRPSSELYIRRGQTDAVHTAWMARNGRSLQTARTSTETRGSMKNNRHGTGFVPPTAERVVRSLEGPGGSAESKYLGTSCYSRETCPCAQFDTDVRRRCVEDWDSG